MISGLSGFGMWILISIADMQNGTVPESVVHFMTEQQCLDVKKIQKQPEKWTCTLADTY